MTDARPERSGHGPDTVSNGPVWSDRARNGHNGVMDLAGAASPLALYEGALDAERPHLVAEDSTGTVVSLPVSRWLDAVGPADEELLQRAVGPVLDVGCGPGRYLHALAARGVQALGVDVSPVAVRLARRQGAEAVVGSIFGQVPQVGSWRTALLADGNIGIGGHPAALLQRLSALLDDEGRVLAELAPPGTGAAARRLRLRIGEEHSGWFDWAEVAADAIHAPAAEAGLVVADQWSVFDRWFVELRVA